MCIFLDPRAIKREARLLETAENYVGLHRRRNRGPGGEGRAPQYFTLETLLILIHAAQIAASQCILRSPPKMSYAYGLYK